MRVGQTNIQISAFLIFISNEVVTAIALPPK
jgi:hypothetical protein